LWQKIQLAITQQQYEVAKKTLVSLAFCKGNKIGTMIYQWRYCKWICDDANEIKKQHCIL